MVNRFGTRCCDKIAATVKKAFLWGFSGEEKRLESMANESPQSTVGEDIFAHGLEQALYVYQPGDGCDVIDEGVNLLWLKQIHLDEISLRPTRNGKVQVSYQGEPIIRMRGVGLIRTEEGCFSLDYWLKSSGWFPTPSMS